MTLQCPKCRQPVPVEDVNIQQAIAKCVYCGELFGFADRVPGAM